MLPSDEMKYLRRPGEGRRNFSMEIVRGNVLARADTPHRIPIVPGVSDQRQGLSAKPLNNQCRTSHLKSSHKPDIALLTFSHPLSCWMSLCVVPSVA